MSYPLFVKRDLDGFFGLAIDNLVQLLLIVSLCSTFCGMSGSDRHFIYQYILPGAAVSLLIGNLFYAAQAHWVARRERRSDVTALPYGINTPSLLVYVFFVMMPTYNQTGSAARAWQMGLIACLGSGIIEFVGAFFAERLRRNTPRAALLSTLAGIAITFIAMAFALQIWQSPLVSMVPLAVILLVYFANVRFPLGLPGGLIAVLLGTGLAWLFTALGVTTGVPMSTDAVREACDVYHRYLPQWVGPTIWATISDAQSRTEILSLFSVILPMGLFNVIGSLQNIESAEAGGDVYATGPSLAVNGLGTIAAAMFGSCFPTTIYIGHPGWKAMGARAGYSTLNGIVMTALCLTGTVAVISKVVPMEAGIAIVLWIGIVITAQSFQATPVRHAPAVALGLFPAIAAWGASVTAGAFDQALFHSVTEPAPIVATAPAGHDPTTRPADLAPGTATQPRGARADVQGLASDAAVSLARQDLPIVRVERQRPATMQDLLTSEDKRLGTQTKVNGFLIHGMNILERGYIFTCMIVAAIAAFLIDRRFKQAAAWSLAAGLMTLLGLMHAYQLTGNSIDYFLIFEKAPPVEAAFTYRALPVALGYLLMGGVFLAVAWRERRSIGITGKTLEDARVVSENHTESEESTC